MLLEIKFLKKKKMGLSEGKMWNFSDNFIRIWDDSMYNCIQPP